MCTEKEFQYILDKKAKREIASLKVRCKNSQPSNPSQGCRWISELREMTADLNSEDGYGYVEVECPNNYCKEEEYYDDEDDKEDYNYDNHNVNYK